MFRKHKNHYGHKSNIEIIVKCTKGHIMKGGELYTHDWKGNCLFICEKCYRDPGVMEMFTFKIPGDMVEPKHGDYKISLVEIDAFKKKFGLNI